MIYTDELDKFTQNKSAEDISDMYEQLYDMRLVFRKSCFNFLFNRLEGTSEENPFKLEVVLEPEGTFGLSSLEMPHLQVMWLDDESNDIMFELDGMSPVVFDSIRDEELAQIINEMK